MEALVESIATLVGVLFVVQGGGGLINNLFGDSKSWFALNYVDLPAPLHLAGHALLLAAGLLMVVRTKGWKWLVED
ncbi:MULTISPECIES: hypothetical protein [Rhodococcus]|uniref:DUF4383 domain-containing protein n=1 Tax=Rhodococcus rhodochrous TaxID=1829 RepID=A0AA46WYA7_RHORH|nr:MULTISPECIES: hypothetical protein [Rhodococcus]MCB8909559.1 hypothetical protein [Rhodococcus rhodochrous]MCD2098235.1 hypothetical protein [Rhodococcus rhodochrous]MCD2122496.1 hypothetical protein [Rhodococcus rhodochrous]MCQ4134210.1 hypothetical protein [Rhodococcus rhodochrous]MDC3725638.1 hypothetical protein [Rhodococcus sp. Rp3]